MTKFGAHSEVGKLRKVLVQRPGLSLFMRAKGIVIRNGDCSESRRSGFVHQSRRCIRAITLKGMCM